MTPFLTKEPAASSRPKRSCGELARNTELPQDIRSYAKSLLRHYPSADQILSLGRLKSAW
ncbi:BPSL0761 family protein [Pseudomonas aeruginosa]